MMSQYVQILKKNNNLGRLTNLLRVKNTNMFGMVTYLYKNVYIVKSTINHAWKAAHSIASYAFLENGRII